MKQLFKDKKEIQDLIFRASDNQKTKNLIFEFSKLKNDRKEFYLQLTELEKILEWKLIGQYYRLKVIREINNTNENVIAITKAAFSITHVDKDIETKIRLKLLTVLSGVEIAVASAILTICFPEKYAVIDFRNWRQMYKAQEKKTNHSPNDYLIYLSEIKIMAENYGFSTQEIDIAIWQKDIEEFG